jgi:hypothetical protein
MVYISRWQCELEARAGFGGGMIVKAEFSAVLGDDGATDGQPHPHAVALGGVERAEDQI